MALVRSISNHPYRGRMRIKGIEYDADDADIATLIALQRVVPVGETPAAPLTYSTRELQSSPAIGATTPPPMSRMKRRPAPTPNVRPPTSDAES